MNEILQANDLCLKTKRVLKFPKTECKHFFFLLKMNIFKGK